MPPINKPTYPANMTEGDLKFSKHKDVLIADHVYFVISSKLREISPPSVQPFSSRIKRILI